MGQRGGNQNIDPKEALSSARNATGVGQRGENHNINPKEVTEEARKMIIKIQKK